MKVEVETPNVPGHVERVDEAKYYDMRQAIEAVAGPDPLTAKAMKEAALPHLSDALFPQGKTAGWWQKCVQLDMEAKGLLTRHATKPLTWTMP